MVTQRNQCLKDAYKNKKLLEFLDVLNWQLADLAIKIITKRMEFLEKMEVWANATHKNITQESEDLQISYLPSFDRRENHRKRL